MRRATTIFAVRPYDAPIFLSTLSLRRATPAGCSNAITARSFLSTLSLRRATNKLEKYYAVDFDFYPRSPCGERLHTIAPCFHLVYISIHALLAESDGIYLYYIRYPMNFYPRSPCGERPKNPFWILCFFRFLSTLSLRRATDTNSKGTGIRKFLSTLSLRRATRTACKPV